MSSVTLLFWVGIIFLEIARNDKLNMLKSYLNLFIIIISKAIRSILLNI